MEVRCLLSPSFPSDMTSCHWGEKILGRGSCVVAHRIITIFNRIVFYGSRAFRYHKEGTERVEVLEKVWSRDHVDGYSGSSQWFYSMDRTLTIINMRRQTPI